RSCYAKTLFLSARDVGSSLLYVGVVLLGEGLYKLIRAGEPACLDYLLVGGVLIAPAEVFLDSSREEKVLLQNYRDVVSQGIEVIAPYVHSSYLYHALGGV